MTKTNIKMKVKKSGGTGENWTKECCPGVMEHGEWNQKSQRQRKVA